MNIGLLFRWGSILMNMVNDPNIHMIARGAWTGIRKLSGPQSPTGPSGPTVNPDGRRPTAGSAKPYAPEFPDFGQFPGTSGQMPSQAEMRKMLKQMGIAPKALQRPHEPPESRGRQALPDPKSHERSSPFPWMQWQPPEGNSAKKRPRNW